MGVARWTFALTLALGLFSSPWARAAADVETLLLESSTPAELRARLLAFAASAPESAVAAKGGAWLHAGLSYERGGRADSALLCYERAVAIRGLPADRDAYADALLDRGRAGDPERVLEILAPRLQVARTNSERDIAVTQGRQAWALYILQRGDSALALMRSQERPLLDPMTPRHRDWRYRIGLLELEHGDPSRCVQIMVPLALESRFQDRDVMGILSEAARKLPQGRVLGDDMKRQLVNIDRVDGKTIADLGGRRVTFTASDGFTVAGVAFPSKRRPARAAVVLMDPDETFEAYDSLATGMARAGYALMLVEPRGSGWSVAPLCPLPATWRGREDEMRDRVAGDALPALRRLAAITPIDTSRYLVVGALASSAAAAKAAALDARARPVVLVSPDPSPVERGPMRSWLSRGRVPVFFEIPIMDHSTTSVAEALYEGLDPRTSRIVESERIGGAARIFRYDASALPRLLLWLDENWSPKRTAPRKAGDRRG